MYVQVGEDDFHLLFGRGHRMRGGVLLLFPESREALCRRRLNGRHSSRGLGEFVPRGGASGDEGPRTRERDDAEAVRDRLERDTTIG